jgi:hypothetical protein
VNDPASAGASGNAASVPSLRPTETCAMSARLAGTIRHGASRLENGNTVLLCTERVPESMHVSLEDAGRREINLTADVILEVTLE